MQEKFQKHCGIFCGIVALIFAYSAYLAASSYSESIEPSSFRSFSVSAEGKIVAIPDVASFTFSVITEGGKDIGALQKENTDKMNKAITFIKDNGVAAKDIKTSNYNLSPRYQYYDCSAPYSSAKPCPPAEIVGYTINQTVAVKIRDFAKVGEILSGVVSNGANNVSQLSFNIDDETLVQSGARLEAIKKAKEKAQAIAKAGGFKVGRLLGIEEGSAYNYPRVMYAKSMDASGMGGAEMAVAPTVEAGSQEVTVNVTLRYEIK